MDVQHLEDNVNRITESEFARVAIIRNGQLAWFLGAGASASAGVPTASHMIADFKASLYCSAMKLDRSDIDADDPLWTERIDRYFDGANGFPSKGDPREYEAAFTHMYPSAVDRRRYIATAAERGSLSFGQRLLGALLATGHTPAVFTTNFDQLIEQAASAANELLGRGDRHPLRISALTNTDIAQRSLAQSDWPLLVKLHGDYSSDSIKNTADELRSQDEVLRLVLTESVRRFGLVVAGYSGRDESIMDALEDGLEAPHPYPNGLFWVLRSSSRPLPRVEAFLAAAEKAGVETRIVVSETFDELLAEVARQAELPTAITTAYKAQNPPPAVIDVALPSVEAAGFPVLRFNALPVLEIPPRVITANSSMENRALRDALRAQRARVDAIGNGSSIVALGSDSDLRAATGDELASSTFGLRASDPVQDTVVRGLLFQALARGLTRGRPFRSHFREGGHELFLSDPSLITNETMRKEVAAALPAFRSVYGADLFGTLPRFDGRRYAEGVRLRFDNRLDRWWLLFEPFTWVEPHPERVRPDPVAAWIRERWFKRRNKEWAQMVAIWAAVIAPHPRTEVYSWTGDQSTKFVLGGTTAWAVPGQEGIR